MPLQSDEAVCPFCGGDADEHDPGWQISVYDSRAHGAEEVETLPFFQCSECYTFFAVREP
jgi:hypothetical protein